MIQFHRLETIHKAYGSINSTFEGSMSSNLGGNSRYAKGTISQGNWFVELLCHHNLPWHCILSLITTQFMENPGRTHREAVKWVFHYLLGTKDWKLVYRTTDNRLKGFMDADRLLQEHCHAISGYVFLINGEAILWSSKKQTLVTLSTAKLEYVAATYAAKKALWLQWLIGKIFHPIEKPITLYSDSQSAIALTKDSLYHAQTKHIDIRYHFICFEVQRGSINLIYCPTEDMTADILTKALPNMKAKHLVKMLGLCPTWGGV